MVEKRGLFIAFEGIDGCGKSTQIKRFVSYVFDKHKHNHVVLTRNPYKDVNIREIIKQGNDPREQSEKLADLFINDRIVQTKELIIPNLDKGHIIISDRFKLSTVTYQGAQGIDMNKLLEKHEGLPIPDITFVFDVPSRVAEHKPKLIWCGATAYPREFPFEEFAKIADEAGAYFATDIAHIAGLVAAGVHKSPVPYAHIITTTTHKTLRGPRGGMIMVTKKGLEKDPELAKKIDKAVFPGLQGGPHDHTIAGIAVTLGEALKPEFKEYAMQIVNNSRELAKTLMANGIKLVSNGTDTHLILVDLTPLGIGLGKDVAVALENAGICCNANSIPKDPSTPFRPSGIRLGTPILTTRGMKENEMIQVGQWISQIIKDKDNVELQKKINQQVKELCARFPFY